MKSLPDYSNLPSCKKISSSIQTVPCEEISLKIDEVNVSDFGELRKKKYSNLLQRIMILRKEKKVFTLVFKKFILPNFFAFLFIFFVLIIENALKFNCSENGSETKYLYSIFRNIFFRVCFFNWWVALCLLEEKSENFVKAIMLFGVLAIIFLIDYHEKYLLMIGNTDYDEYVFSVFFRLFFILP